MYCHLLKLIVGSCNRNLIATADKVACSLHPENKKRRRLWLDMTISMAMNLIIAGQKIPHGYKLITVIILFNLLCNVYKEPCNNIYHLTARSHLELSCPCEKHSIVREDFVIYKESLLRNRARGKIYLETWHKTKWSAKAVGTYRHHNTQKHFTSNDRTKKENI